MLVHATFSYLKKNTFNVYLNTMNNKYCKLRNSDFMF